MKSYYLNGKRIHASLKKGPKVVYLTFILSGIFICNAFAQELHSIRGVGPQINSVFEEFNPILTADGNVMYFCRGRHPENMGGRRDLGDIWYSVKDENGNWQKAQNIGPPINNAYKNDIAGISADGKTLFLHYDYGKSGLEWKPGLSYSRKTANGWTVPEKINIPYFYNNSDHQSAFISEDEKIMILSIDSYGSYGAEDLYVCFKQSSGGWTEPMNLGPGINTAQQEMTPFLSRDNKTLFFVSNGRQGKGSKDIFRATRLDNTWKNWSVPENVGDNINTEGRELYYHQDKKFEWVYFVSIQNSEGYGDIYQARIGKENMPDPNIDENFFPPDLSEENLDPLFQVPDTVIVFNFESDIVIDEEKEPTLKFSGKITNEFSKKGIAALITLETEGMSKQIVSGSEDGLFNVALTAPGVYKVYISARGFMAREESIEIVDSSQHDFALMPLEIGTTVQLKDVLFEQGTASMLKASYAQLDKVANMMLENPNLVIQLAGHTDNQGVAKLNVKLSQDRVEVVKKYLVQKGVEGQRITGVGYGGLKPIASNKSEETRQLNRRVEFTIVKN